MFENGVLEKNLVAAQSLGHKEYARNKDIVCDSPIDREADQGENHVNNEDAKEIENTQLKLGRSGRVRRLSLRLLGAAVVTLKDLLWYRKGIRGSESELWEDVMREVLGFIEASNTWTHAKLLHGKKAVLCKTVLKRKLDAR